jgi:hypothetical protein
MGYYTSGKRPARDALRCPAGRDYSAAGGPNLNRQVARFVLEGLAIITVVVGEYLGASRGIGYVIAQAERVFDTTGVFAGMTVLAAGVLLVGVPSIDSSAGCSVGSQNPPTLAPDEFRDAYVRCKYPNRPL